jgi:hypothetical protein
MTEPVFPACANCRYYSPQAHHAAKEGSCRRYGPGQFQDETPDESEPPEPDEDGTTTLIAIGTNVYTGWPDVMASDWCGEFDPPPAEPRRRSPKVGP